MTLIKFNQIYRGQYPFSSAINETIEPLSYFIPPKFWNALVLYFESQIIIQHSS